MTNVQDQNEVNVAMRGIYTSSQQKILILLDSQRLNSHVYSMATPDFSIGLDKVKQMVVLHGPGSSLYGNVALTAVINIALKKDSDAEGVKVTSVNCSALFLKKPYLLHSSMGNEQACFESSVILSHCCASTNSLGATQVPPTHSTLGKLK